MSQMKSERLLTDITIHDTSPSQQTEMDLAMLADQLLAIAGELRRNEETGTDKACVSGAPLELAPRADRLAQLTKREDSSSGYSGRSKQRQDHLNWAKAAYTNRRTRTAVFGNPELFGEPAWDILLDLYIAYVEDKPVSVSSACIGSAAPPTTGLRWLGVLAENNLVLREHDPEDQRRVLVRLTAAGLAAMDEYFVRVRAAA